jgi:UDP-N-acetylglucosamine:LPS N-acetylglucosamine transferase
LTAQALYEAADALLRDAPRRESMRSALHEMAVVDSAERICQTVLDLAKT